METNLLIKNSIERLKKGIATDFVNLEEVSLITKILKREHVPFQIFRPFPDAEKVIIYNNNPPSVILFKIISKEKLTHKEILGTLFSHNIMPHKYGDIIVKDDCYIIILASLKDYLIFNFNLVGRHKVTLEESPITEIIDYHYNYDELIFLISSLRLDNVVATITHLSRTKTEILLNNKDVQINYAVNNKKTYILKENDIISIRHYGKYIYKGIINVTKKKYVVKILKYK